MRYFPHIVMSIVLAWGAYQPPGYAQAFVQAVVILLSLVVAKADVPDVTPPIQDTKELDELKRRVGALEMDKAFRR